LYKSISPLHKNSSPPFACDAPMTRKFMVLLQMRMTSQLRFVALYQHLSTYRLDSDPLSISSRTDNLAGECLNSRCTWILPHGYHAQSRRDLKLSLFQTECPCSTSRTEHAKAKSKRYESEYRYQNIESPNRKQIISQMKNKFYDKYPILQRDCCTYPENPC
jgi:hypothetical protein